MTKEKRELFGTDGIRGLAGKYPLNDKGAVQVGRAIGKQFGRPGQRVVMAADPRQSSAELVAAVSRGLNAVGLDVTYIGVLPTPGLAYITREHDEFVAGVMITASHNPVEYNGIKVFDGRGDKLSDETEANLNVLIEQEIADKASGSSTTDESLASQYEDFLVSNGSDLDGVAIAVDSANGAASGLAERVFKRLSAQITAMFDKPDGQNINDHCGATDTESLRRTVVEKGLDLGVALDGDADRLIMADARGREVKGDYLLYILAVATHAKGVVATTMSNQGFELALRGKDIELVRTDVGDRYILEALAKTGWSLGGEQSGHIILPKLLKTGDGLLAAVQVLKAVADSGRSLAEWCDEVNLLPQALVNLPLADKSALDRPAIKEFIKQHNDNLDGGRLLIRPSGTEPLARVMVEADDAQDKAEAIAAELKELL